ncbi:nucleoside-diphosphate kinase [Candidatus Pacearchaeota archaeon]|jgi:nucleoside-diphosphate kinase|nr:nucleoside-diphosphate kinase [Candidatus Pacearchaeota archaeon]
MIERTLIVLKPDTIQRGLVGKIVSRFEEVGLKLIGMKMIHCSKEFAEQHYPLDKEWAKNVYRKSKEKHDRIGKELRFKDYMEMGKSIQKWNIDFLCESPIIAIVLEGPHAIELVRKMTGDTEPLQSAPGTIRGDFASVESYQLTDSKNRVLRNLIHASDSTKTAEREISLWFSESELFKYQKELDKHF